MAVVTAAVYTRGCKVMICMVVMAMPAIVKMTIAAVAEEETVVAKAII